MLLSSLVAAFTLSNAIGVILVAVGLWLVISGAPSVSPNLAGLGEIIKEIFTKYPRVGIGLVLIILGGIFLGVDFGPVLGGDSG